MTTEKHLEVSGSIRLNLDEQLFLGSGRIRLLEKIDELGSITRAAKAVGISYKTVWDLVNMMNNLSDKPLVERQTGGKGGGGTTLTAEGKTVINKYRIFQEEHHKFLDTLTHRLGDTESLNIFFRRIPMKVSARNVIAGKVSRIIRGAVNAEVVLLLKGGAQLVAVITNDAVDNLELAPGRDAFAIVKASSVIVGTDLHDAKVSARNIMCGTVSRIVEGPVNAEIDIDMDGGNSISAVITEESCKKLGLVVGGHACAMIKASSVIIGVT